MTSPVPHAADFNHAIALLADIAGPSYPLGVSEDTQRLVIHQLVADLFGYTVEEVTQAVDYAVEENARFQVEAGVVRIRADINDHDTAWVTVGTVNDAEKTADLYDPHDINRSEQFRSDVICSKEISDARAWLEVKGYSVTD